MRARALSSVSSTKPTIEMAKAMPREYHEMSDKMIMRLAVGGNYKACKERMVREVTAVDGVDYATAVAKVDEMSSVNTPGSLSMVHQLPDMAIGKEPAQNVGP